MAAGTSPAEASATVCWSCGAAADGARFCASCGKIQPLPPTAEYFALLGLPRKLDVNEDQLEQRFHQLSWKLHPDNFVRASEHERLLSLEASSQLNDAFRTLRDRVSRIEYLLGQAGMRREGQHKQQAPPELLEEVFELNESLDELREARQAGGDPAARAELGRRLENERRSFETKLELVDMELEGLSSDWDRAMDAADEAAQQKLMERMNEALNRRSYIRNLVQSVQKELAEA
jgi:molecular chaperone HscB